MNYKDLDIVFLTKEIPDYIHDVIFLGLCQLGCNVVDIPFKGSLHGIRHPSKFHSEQLLFNLPRMQLRKKPDLMIVTSLAYDYNPLGMNGWMKQVKEAEEIFQPERNIALDGSDKQETSLPILKKDYWCVFKREMFKRPSNSWFPLQFAPVLEPFTYRFYEERDFDFTYMVSPSHPRRQRYAEYLMDFSEKNKLNSIVSCAAPTIPRDKYLEYLSRSRCSISPMGMGYGCYRYWEIPAKGTVMVAEDVGIIIPNDFDSNQILKFPLDDEKAMGEAILRVRDMSCTELADMAYKAQYHVSAYHTPSKRAAELLSKVFETKE